jgi:hypothetical protein
MLIDLAADRPIRDPRVENPRVLVDVARAHRMLGLLSSAVANGRVDLGEGAARALATRDLGIQAHHRRLWAAIDEAVRRLRSVDVAVAVLKGVPVERRWYARAGERPCSDVDLLLEPSAVQRADVAISVLDPGPLHLPEAAEMMRTGVLQSFDLSVGGVAIDLHADPLKIEIPTRGFRQLWERTQLLPGPRNVPVRMLDAEGSLIHFLLHLNKDRFARLLGYADVARILAQEDLDWSFVDGWLGHEGLRTPAYGALLRVTAVLAIPRPLVVRPGGWRRRAWERLWPEHEQLQGSEGWAIRERRQLWIALLAEGRAAAAVRWLIRRRLFPPPALVRAHYPSIPGPYLLRLLVGRLRRAARR